MKYNCAQDYAGCTNKVTIPWGTCEQSVARRNDPKVNKQELVYACMILCPKCEAEEEKRLADMVAKYGEYWRRGKKYWEETEIK